ncbi:esterase/lipase family protein [Cystobacter ferrugineus]|uniref:Phospholipase/carboxylesterase/thioesterase domain-containing protein n=1 Tax=Cystobacter ferrugineus TaxID=83449 RepID=A0A1L9AUB0_9BACT|nr:hypothetical protein [Cystobacter ferrugineus]OJH33572.1 hypothetical protein BON30_48145 [Cystobacter ferrugineus]
MKNQLMHAATAAPGRVPVLLVHGLDDDARSLAPLANGLTRAGFRDVQPVELKPNNGAAPICVLAEQVAEAARGLRARTERGSAPSPSSSTR